MKSTRHPHAHVDPRQPRNGTRPCTNPPVFAWKPQDGADRFSLLVARDRSLNDVVLAEAELTEPTYLPERTFAPGRYFWQWSTPSAEGEVFEFEITPEAVGLEVPSPAVWLERMPKTHPRICVSPEDLPAIRASRHRERAGLWRGLEADAQKILAQPHEIEEPPFLPEESSDYGNWYAVFSRGMRDSHGFMRGAMTLALAYLASGEAQYARAACKRIASMSMWDPEGSSHIGHFDEAHMAVIWNGPQASDWVWDQFTEEERVLVIDQFRRRGQITFEYMHNPGSGGVTRLDSHGKGSRPAPMRSNLGSYGVTRFDSHAGREIVFLAMIALVFHEEIPEALGWLEWLRPVLCGIWPVWAGDDGGWAEGLCYGLSYVSIMTMFASALKLGTGVDLYRRPFWRSHGEWRRWCWPPYAEWLGFGDRTERWGQTWRSNADLVELIDRESGTGSLADYVADLRREAETCSTPAARQGPQIAPLRYLSGSPTGASTAAGETDSDRMLRMFPAAGWAAIRTDLTDPARDVAFIFRSSPYGAVSHSHANNNDFIIHVGGKVMAMPSGYYDGYGSEHHMHWVWHTKSHNCVTLSDASQLMCSYNSRGAVERAFEDDRLAYFVGDADASYVLQAERCRRHVIFLKAHTCFVMVDEVVLKPDVTGGLQWNIHAWAPFEVDEGARTFRLDREGRRLMGHFLHHQNSFFSLSEGWDPPPGSARPRESWQNQYHLRFTASNLIPRRNLGVVLCPSSPDIHASEVITERIGEVEIAHIAGDTVVVNQGKGIEYEGVSTRALALVLLEGARYEVSDEGIRSVRT